MDRSVRRPNRLPHFDYSQAGYYFVTVCTQNRAFLLWDPVSPPPTKCSGLCVGADIIRPLCRLSPLGLIVEDAIRQIPSHYPNVALMKYVVMPNHIHLILALNETGGRMISAPTKSLSTIIGSMKRYTSKTAGFPLWQKSFHDHIIRKEADYLRIWQYIDTNPLKWEQDRYYTPAVPQAEQI